MSPRYLTDSFTIQWRFSDTLLSFITVLWQLRLPSPHWPNPSRHFSVATSTLRTTTHVPPGKGDIEKPQEETDSLVPFQGHWLKDNGQGEKCSDKSKPHLQLSLSSPVTQEPEHIGQSLSDLLQEGEGRAGLWGSGKPMLWAPAT